jgi:hypothetical protein
VAAPFSIASFTISLMYMAAPRRIVVRRDYTFFAEAAARTHEL